MYDHRSHLKTPGTAGEEMTRLLANSSPVVTTHEGRIKFKNVGLNESQISDESFGDLSLMSGAVDFSVQAGDISVQVMSDVNRY